MTAWDTNTGNITLTF